jgi:ElaB/YqjD/DUF883 family membrane-anchored ribosome-binding protein
METQYETEGDLRDKLNATIEKAKAACQRMQEQTLAAAKKSDQVIREHPYQAAGIAFGVGLLVGLLVTRARRD